MSNENRVGAYMNQVRHAADKKFGRTPFELRLDGAYSNVIYRLGQALPIDVMLDWFSSTPNETGGKAKFPYSRIDSNLIVAGDYLELMDMVKEDGKKKEYYGQATRQVARALSWIDIGWGGLENFASNPDATVNWTSGPGHSADAEGRARWIVTEGREWIDKVVEEYKKARATYDQKYGGDDVFRKYKIEHLLIR